MSTLNILRAEGAAFRRAAQSIAMFEPRHITQGVFGGKFLRINGANKIDLSGLDYLAFGSDPVIKQVMTESLLRHDCGIPGSEAIIQMAQSVELERALVRYHLGPNTDGAAITFTAGYGTNFSIMEALGLRGNSHFITMHGAVMPLHETRDIPTEFYLDGDLHFSARHGIRFARKLAPERCLAHTFRTGDYDHLEALLRESRARLGDRAVRVVLTDSVESATGKLFDLDALCQLAERHDCLVYVDEAHAVGVVGPQGRGVAAQLPAFERYRDRLMIMGTLTKAFCQPGGYVVMRDPGLAQMLKFCSPQHVFSAPIAPWVANALVHVLELLAGDHGEQRREQVRRISRYAVERMQHAGFEMIGAPNSPILATPLRAPRVGTQVLEHMQEAGFVISLFQAPLMPVGHEVLRFAMRADLDPGEIDRLVVELARCRDRLHFSSSEAAR